MSRFLFTVWPFPGHLHPNFAIAHTLKEAGHEVAFYTGTKAASRVEKEGFLCFPFKQVDEKRVERTVFSLRSVPSLLKNPFTMIGIYRSWLLDTVPNQVEDLDNLLLQWPPHVIVCDPTFWGPILILHETGKIPVAISSFIPGCMIPGPDAPPWGLGLPSPRSLGKRLLARMVGGATDLLSLSFRRVVNGLRARYDLPPLACSVNAFTSRLPLYLIPSVPELDYNRHDLPPSVHYVGPCVWNKPYNEPPPEWLAKIPRDRPWVHVTEGTMHAQSPFVLRAAAQGLADLPLQVIMTGGNRNPEELDIGRIAPNIRIERWVPHSDLLPLTDVMVSTGGASTILAGLNAGVPMVLVPTQWDKPDNAQRVVEAGAGLRLAPNRCTPKQLRAAVERVLAEPSFRQNAQRLATIFRRYGGAPKAAELLTSLCT
jgi:UDP:flavonoid glycosyltransferase YjiC (YdhE family)